MCHRSRARFALIACVSLIFAVVYSTEGLRLLPRRNSQKFLYLGRNDSGFVEEYEGGGETDRNRPSFLYSAHTVPRVVEFYAPWCPHCQHFRTQYIDYAQKIMELVSTSNETTVDTIKFYAVSCTEHPNICQEFRVDSFPRIKIFLSTQSEPLEDIYPHLPDPYTLLTKLEVAGLDNMKLGDGSSTKADQSSDTKRLLFALLKRSLFNDAYLAFEISLRSAFGRDDGIGGKTKSSLRMWLALLKMAAPDSLREVVTSVLEDVDKGQPTMESLAEVFDHHKNIKVSDRFSLACSRGQEGEGYLCGMWKLFHIMTIGVLEYNINLGGKNNYAISVEDAATALRGFIADVLDCEECRVNFLHFFDTCDQDRCNRLSSEKTVLVWSQFPLWLVDLHNQFNILVSEERADSRDVILSEDERIRAKWPFRSDCPKCWKDDGSIDEEIAVKHLRITYWVEDSTATAYRIELGEHSFLSTFSEAGHDNIQHEASDKDSFFTIDKLFFGILLLLFISILVIRFVLNTGRAHTHID